MNSLREKSANPRRSPDLETRGSYLHCRRIGVLIAVNNGYLLLLRLIVACQHAEGVLFFAFPWLNHVGLSSTCPAGRRHICGVYACGRGDVSEFAISGFGAV